ncbi:DUF3572 domain-containing protein [Aerophototrophica crusticola]|uniref:DUF3572 domain-containing protein n=1 Tax=Aerophototrophica crusticola TaxID=1709002 RepID=A0A858R358_9PROT|nr:DUF3572 domain-containing protein [Rhodospirillaceae bacterium B3]
MLIPKKGTTAKPAADPEAVALRAVAFVVSDEDMLARFVALTGCGGDELRARLADPAFLGGVLDFVLGDEGLATAFAAGEELTPEDLAAVRAKLP